MSRSFDINPTVTRLIVQAGATDRVSFPVTNRLTKKVDAHVELDAKDKAQSWLKLDGEPVRTMQPDETDLVTVNVQVPTETSLGEYSFGLRVSNIVSAHDEFATSPAITVQVVPKKVEEVKKSYWWVWLIAGAVVIVGAGVGLIVWGMAPGFQKACTDECAADLACMPGQDQQKICLRVDGQACEAASDCAGAMCQDGKCLTGVAWSQLFPGVKLDCERVLTAAQLAAGTNVTCSVPAGSRKVKVSGTLSASALVLSGSDAVNPAGARFMTDSAVVKVTPAGITWGGKVFLTKPLLAAAGSEGTRAAPQAAALAIAENPLYRMHVGAALTGAALVQYAEVFKRDQIAIKTDIVNQLRQQVAAKQQELSAAQQSLRDKRSQLQPVIDNLRAQANMFGNLGGIFGSQLAAFEAMAREHENTLAQAEREVQRLTVELAELRARLSAAEADLETAKQLAASEAAKQAAEAERRRAEAAARKAEADRAADKVLGEPIAIEGALQGDGSYTLKGAKALKTPYADGDVSLELTAQGVRGSFQGVVCRNPFDTEAARDQCPQVNTQIPPDGKVCAGSVCADVVRLNP